MNADMINMGYAGGYAAAMAVQSGQSLRQLDLRPVQNHLVQVGNLTPEHLSSARDAEPPTEAALKAAAADPKSREELAILFYGGKRSLPVLRTSFAAAPTVNKGVALCTLGDPAAVPYLSSWLKSQSIGQGDRYTWDNFINHREIEAVMWCIGIPGDERVIDALVQKLQQCDLEDNWSRIRVITGALGRIGSPKAAQNLHDFLLSPGVSGHARITATQDDIKAASFSKAYTELFVATALYRCGDLNGLGRSTLESYLNDWRGIFHRYAGHVLFAEEDR
jgi:HEAT repeat protein